MDEEIMRQASALTNLHIRTTPYFIDHLPTETLEAIFILCAADYHGEDVGHPIQAAPSWVNVSYVSSYWRKIALNCPLLWTYLFITSRPWTEALLARSKQAPLRVKVNLHGRQTKFHTVYFLERVMEHLERIQELYLRFSSLSYPLISRLSSRAPCLQSLVIVTPASLHGGWYSSVLFDGDTPALRTLELRNCLMPWYSLKLSGLTRLSLESAPHLVQQNMAEFLTTLGHMPHLTHLCLEDALASASDFTSSAAFHTFQKIDLPYLSHLLVTAPLLTVIALLSCINVPLTTYINLNLKRPSEHISPTFDDYATLCSLLAQRLRMLEDQALASSTIRRLVIIFMPGWHAVRLTFAASEHGFSVSRDPVHPLRMYIPFDESMTTGDRGRVISHVCYSMPLSNVRSVYVLNPRFTTTSWARVLGHLQGVRCIELHQGNMPDLAAVLSIVPHNFLEYQGADQDQGPHHMIAPALEELKLYRMTFSNVLAQRDHTGLPRAIDVQSLCDALATRKGRRGQLTMIDCTEIDSESRRKTVDMVGWWEGGRFSVDYRHGSVDKGRGEQSENLDL